MTQEGMNNESTLFDQKANEPPKSEADSTAYSCCGRMIVMPSNNTGRAVVMLSDSYPGRIGNLHTPDSIRKPKPVPFALDNGVYGAWSNGREWDEVKYYKALDFYDPLECRWTVVPDWVADKKLTLKKWDEHSDRIRQKGFTLAFAVQDGMSPDDVPDDADVIFVGGSTEWKWRTLPIWGREFERVHAARVNTYRLLWMADDCGVESCDGTGFTRGDQKQWNGLCEYLEESTAGKRNQRELFAADSFLNI